MSISSVRIVPAPGMGKPNQSTYVRDGRPSPPRRSPRAVRDPAGVAGGAGRARRPPRPPAASLATLFGAALPPGLAEDARERAARHARWAGCGSTVRPPGAIPVATWRRRPSIPADFFPGSERGADLRGARRDGRPRPSQVGRPPPLGRDRGRDGAAAVRPWRARCSRPDAPTSSRSATRVLMTPAADGRILPGIARAGAIAVAGEAGIEVAERSLTETSCSSRRGLPDRLGARSRAGPRRSTAAALPPPGELSRRVGEGLRRRWLGGPVASAAPAPAAAPPPGPLAR